MCGPAAPAAAGLMWASFAAAAAGTAVSVVGQMNAASAARKAAARNAELARDAAAQTREVGRQREVQKRLKIGELMGRQRALIGSSGLVVDKGTTARVVEDTAWMGEHEALTERNNATRLAWGQEAQAGNFVYQGEVAAQQNTWGAGASALSGASRGLSLWPGTNNKKGGSTSPTSTVGYG